MELADEESRYRRRLRIAVARAVILAFLVQLRLRNGIGSTFNRGSGSDHSGESDTVCTATLWSDAALYIGKALPIKKTPA